MTDTGEVNNRVIASDANREEISNDLNSAEGRVFRFSLHSASHCCQHAAPN